MFLECISDHANSLHFALNNNLSKTRKLVLVALLSSVGAILQSTGGFLLGVGIFLSPLATAPIIFCSIISNFFSFYSYILTILLLVILQPSELLVFPFTTGMLGIGIGISFRYFKRRIYIILMGMAVLSIGIFILLYILKFPILGSTIPTSFQTKNVLSILLFTFMYSWIWVEISYTSFRKLKTYLN